MSVVGCIYSDKYLSAICLVGEMSVRNVSGWGSVRRGCVWSGKRLSGMCLVGEMSVGEESIWEMSSGMCLGIEINIGCHW